MRAGAAILLLAIPICAAESGPATGCVEVGGASIWAGPGWNHVVYLTNRCSRDVVCDVSTNVSPEPKVVACKNNETVQVPTALNATERVFSPLVSCDYP